MKCQHENCDGELIYKADMEEKGRFGVFECNKCHCIFSLMNVRKNENCPSVKSEKKKQTVKEVSVEGTAGLEWSGKIPVADIKQVEFECGVKRGRGRPKGSKNKKYKNNEMRKDV